MHKLLKKVLQVGEATVQYPFKPLEVAPGFRGKPVYDFNRCIACSACAIACPSNAITMENDFKQGIVTWKINYGQCIFCARCDEVCPTRAIALSEEFELAAVKKEDLYCQSEIQLSKCNSCGDYFAPSRELGYVLSNLEQEGLADQDYEEWQEIMNLCPECKRRERATHWIHGHGKRKEA